MAKLETYTASGQTRQGPVAPNVPASVLTAPYEALANVGGAIQQNAAVVSQIASKREQENNEKWLTESTSQFTRVMAEWQNNPENKGKETFGPEFQQFADEQLKEYMKAAPNALARDKFQRDVLPDIDRRIGHALQQGEQNRIVNSIAANDKSAQDLLSAYKFDAEIDPVWAAQGLAPLVSKQLASIQHRFGKTSPAIAEKMTADLVANIVIGTAPSNPDYARALLESVPLDEKLRSTLEGEIRKTENATDYVAQTLFKQSTASAIANARTNGTRLRDIPLSEFKDVYGTATNRYEAEKLEYDQEKDAINGALSVTDTLKGKNASTIASTINALPKEGGTVGEAALKSAQQFGSKLIKQMVEDPASYVEDHNENVQRIITFAKDAPDHMKAFAVQRAHELSITYQGAAPKDAADKDSYLNFDEHQWAALRNSTSETWADRINNGTPDNRLKAIQEFEALYGKVRHYAWRDITRLPGGKAVSQEMQLAALNKNQPEVRQYLSALSNVEALKQLKDDKLKDYKEALHGDTTWRAFAAQAGGDNWQNAGTAAGFQRGVLAMALSLGGDPKTSVKTAVDVLIKRNYAAVEVNDQNLLLAKWRDDGQEYRSDVEIAWIGGNLERNLAQLDLSRIAITSPNGRPLFPNAPAKTSADNVALYLQQALSGRTLFVPSTDGQGVFLYYRGDGAIPSQLRDTDNKPLFLPLNDISDADKANWPMLPEGKRNPQFDGDDNYNRF